jgi:ArsR family transcriptional regulator
MATKAIPMADACCSVLTTSVDDVQAAELAKGFAALADPVRLRLFSMVASAGTACSWCPSGSPPCVAH